MKSHVQVQVRLSEQLFLKNLSRMSQEMSAESQTSVSIPAESGVSRLYKNEFNHSYIVVSIYFFLFFFVIGDRRWERFFPQLCQ